MRIDDKHGWFKAQSAKEKLAQVKGSNCSTKLLFDGMIALTPEWLVGLRYRQRTFIMHTALTLASLVSIL